MPSNRSKYTVNVLLNPESLPSEDKNVFYSSANNRFELGIVSESGGGGEANELEVGPLSDYTGLTTGEHQFGLFSRANDNSSTTVSGSDGIAVVAIAGIESSVRQNEFRITTGSSANGEDDIKSVGIFMPLRVQNQTNLDPATSPFQYYKYSPVANYLEHVQVVREGSLNAGQITDFMTISLDDVGNYIGSSSYQVGTAGITVPTVSGSYNYVKIEHVAMNAYTSAARRTQKCTHHFAWTRDNSSPYGALDLTVSSVEDVRAPQNRIIIDPFRTTGSFNENGDLVISIYHYNVDYCQHILKYTLM